MIYFIGGLSNREFKYFEIIEKIRKENKGIQEFFFDVDIKEEDKFLEKVSFNSIFSLDELVVLKRAEKLKDIEKIVDYICDLDINNKEIIIDYNREDGKIPVKLNKKLEKYKEENKLKLFLYTKENESDIKNYIQEELNISQKEAIFLLEMIGNNPFKIKNEIAKIKIFLNGEKYNINEIKNIISIEKDFEIYEITGKILDNSPKEVLDYLEKTKEYMGVLYSLYNELETMYKLSSLAKSGLNLSSNYNVFKNQFEDIKEIFKTNNRIPNPYAIFKKMEKIKNYSNKNLKKLVYRCWEIENDIKKGKIAMEAGTETLIMEIVNLYGKK